MEKKNINRIKKNQFFSIYITNNVYEKICKNIKKYKEPKY